MSSVMATKPGKVESEAQGSVAATSAAQQSDNIAHALAGAGGGLLAMTLTYALHPLLVAGH